MSPITFRIGSWQFRLNKEKAPVCVVTKQSEAVWAQIPSDLREVIHKYFKAFDNYSEASSYQSDTFVKEVYYATTLDRVASLSRREMEARIRAINETKLRLISFEIDECIKVNNGLMLIGVVRQFSDNIKNRVLYFLEKRNGKWKFHHIARSVRGSIVDKFQIGHQLCFIIGTQDWNMLFLSSDVSLGNDYQLGEQVNVEGYLEITDLAPADWVHRIVRLNRIH